MSDLSSLYQEVILDEARRRVGEGELDTYSTEHFERNPACGDEVTVRLLLENEDRPSPASRIAEIGWRGDGCSISMASTSIAVQQLRGRTVAEARAAVAAMRQLLRSRGRVHYEDDSTEAELLGDAVAFEGTAKYVMRVKCAMLMWVAVEQALNALVPEDSPGTSA